MKGPTLNGTTAEASDRSLVREVIAFLRTEGDQSWIVGGYVRDKLLGRPTADLDAVAASHGVRLARAVADRFDGAYYALDDTRDIGRAILSGEDGQIIVDISRIQGGSLEQDLSQRDFTINAMALDLKTDPPNLIDLHGGRSDLRSGVIRSLKQTSFQDDPVRLLRAIRFEAEFGFSVEEQTELWMRQDAAMLASASPERVQHELVLLLRGLGAAERLRRLDGCHLLGVILPELLELKDVPQSLPHHLDVFDHSVETVNRLEIVLETLLVPGSSVAASGDSPLWLERPMELLADRLAPLSRQILNHLSSSTSADRTRYTMLKWAALLHDVGKPGTRSIDADGRIRFLGHAVEGAELVESITRRLRFSGSEASLMKQIVRNHLRPSLLAREPSLTRRAVYRFFRDTGATGVDICLLMLADHLATWGEHLLPDRWERRVATAESLIAAYFCHREASVAPTQLISGEDLIQELGMKQGPAIGLVLEQIREAQVTREVMTREEALSQARRLAASLS